MQNIVSIEDTHILRHIKTCNTKERDSGAEGRNTIKWMKTDQDLTHYQ